MEKTKWRQARCSRTFEQGIIYADSREILEPPDHLEAGERPVEWKEMVGKEEFEVKFKDLGKLLSNPWLEEVHLKTMIFNYRLLQKAYASWRHTPFKRGNRVFFVKDGLSYLFIVLVNEGRPY